MDYYHYLQQLINGLTVGSTYALIAIGYTMVYGIIGMINFAHGEVYMIGSYIAFIALLGLSMMGLESVPLLIIGAFILSMIVTCTYGYSIERVAYRPLRGSNRLIPLITAIGMSIFLQDYVKLGQGTDDKSIQPLISGNLELAGGQLMIDQRELYKYHSPNHLQRLSLWLGFLSLSLLTSVISINWFIL